MEARVEEPDEVKITVSETMKLKDWRTLVRKLRQTEDAEHWPTGHFIREIEDVIHRVTKDVFAFVPEELG